MSAVPALLIALVAISSGVLLVRFALPGIAVTTQACVGTIGGLALLAWIGFLASLVLGLNPLSIVLTASILAAAGALLWRFGAVQGLGRDLRSLRLDRADLITYGAWTALLCWLFGRVLTTTDDGGLATAPLNNFGDLPFHLGVIHAFAYGENLPPIHPSYDGLRFTYPFLIDFLAAFFIRSGAGSATAMFIGNLLLSLALVGLLDILTRRLTGDARAGRIAPLLLLFNGGLGFLNLWGDMGRFFADPNRWQGGLVGFFTHLPGPYTIQTALRIGEGAVPLRMGNVFTTLLIPQRSILFGLSFAAAILLLWWKAFHRNKPGDPAARSLAAAGALTGLLPMLHTHSFVAISMAAPLVFALHRSRAWLWYLFPAVALAGPQILWLSGTPAAESFLKPHFGWEAGGSNLAVFWAANAGALIGLAAAVLFSARIAPWPMRRFYLPFAAWFVVPNAVLLAPWAWDNIKVLACWVLASAPLAALALSRMIAHPRASVRAAGGILFATATLSGGLDVLRALSPVERTVLYRPDQVDLAGRIRESTPPGSVLLHFPIHNSVAALAGRRSAMGYPGHLWTHGIDYAGRDRDLRAAFRGGDGAAEALTRLDADYVVIGPADPSPVQVDETFFADRFPLLFRHGAYRVYRLPK